VGRFNRQDPVAFKIAMASKDELKKLTGMNQQELLENPQVLNSYAYVVNNPVKMIDENGEFAGPFGRDMASGQRSIASFLHKAADYTSSQGGFINKVSGFVTNAIADTVDNIANVYDPDQKADVRLVALGLTVLDSATGGEGKGAGKVVSKIDDSFVRAAKHAIEDGGKFAGKSLDEVVQLARNAYNNFDIKVTVKNMKKYYYNAKENILFINNLKQPTIFSPKAGLDYLRRAIKTDILKGGGSR